MRATFLMPTNATFVELDFLHAGFQLSQQDQDVGSPHCRFGVVSPNAPISLHHDE